MGKKGLIRHDVGTTSDNLLTGTAVPDASSSAANGVLQEKEEESKKKLSEEKVLKAPHLTAERASVLGVLSDFHLLHDLSERSTITCTVLTSDSNLASALGLERKKVKYKC
jgi:hypothetical protein